MPRTRVHNLNVSRALRRHSRAAVDDHAADPGPRRRAPDHHLYVLARISRDTPDPLRGDTLQLENPRHHPDAIDARAWTWTWTWNLTT